MSWEYLLRGMLLGLYIAAPVGPICLLCIKNTLSHGFKTGMLSGLGAATADAIYAIIAGYGLSSIMSSISPYTLTVQILGGLFICYLGIKTFLQPPLKINAKTKTTKYPLSAFFTTLLLTLSNPMTILFFLSVFSASGIILSYSDSEISSFISGIFIGSASWWFCLTGITLLIRMKITERRATQISLFNKLSGLLLLCFGLFALLRLQ